MMYAARKPGPTMRVYIDNAAAATTTSTSQRRRASGPTRGEAGRGTAPLLPLITAPFTAPRCKKNLAKDTAHLGGGPAQTAINYFTRHAEEREGVRGRGRGDAAMTPGPPPARVTHQPPSSTRFDFLHNMYIKSHYTPTGTATSRRNWRPIKNRGKVGFVNGTINKTYPPLGKGRSPKARVFKQDFDYRFGQTEASARRRIQKMEREGGMMASL